MEFEHIVQINDPQLLGVEFLSRDQLWLGLVAKAYRPEQFNTALESTAILSEQQLDTHTKLTRSINFGSLKFNDSIELYPLEKTVNRIPETDFCGEACLTISIEEPEPNLLWLRFRYEIQELEDQSDNNCSQTEMNEARKQAYKALDIDTVKVIRSLAQMNPDLKPDPRHLH